MQFVVVNSQNRNQFSILDYLRSIYIQQPKSKEYDHKTNYITIKTRRDTHTAEF
jgi:hypothetical protein